MSFTGKRTPATPGAIFRGKVYCHPDYPGVQFIYPWESEASGRPVTRRGGWPAAMVVVEGDVADDVVIAAAAFAGRMTWSVRAMRRAALVWLHSTDHNRNPHRVSEVRAA